MGLVSYSKNFGLRGFNSAVPKNWYTNERLLEAMAATSPQNAKFIEYVKKNVPKEKLANYFEKIDNDGQVRTYERTA